MRFNAFPVVRYVLCFIAGILGYLFTDYFHIVFYYLLAGLVPCLLITALYGNRLVLRGTLACLLIFLSGWIITNLKTVTSNPTHFTNQGDFTYYQAVVTSNAEIKPKTYKVEAEIQRIKTEEGWKDSEGKVILLINKDEPHKPAYGDVYLIKGMPGETDPARNPYEFDYKQYLAYKGIYARHFLWDKEYLILDNRPPSVISNLAYKANLYADSVFKAHLKHRNDYAAANAMIVGIRDDIDDELLESYAISGAIHVLSVSGMHVGILLWVLNLILSGLRKRGKAGLWAYLIITLAVLWAYAVFTGLSSTVLRATVTFTFLLVGTTLNRSLNMYNLLAASALVLLCWNPYWLVDIGFQLSYLAIIGIVYLYPYLNQLVSPANPLLRMAWEGTVVCFAAQLFTTPLSIYYFHQFPVYFLIANPFVAIFSFSILPAGLLLLVFSAVPGLAGVLGFILKCSCFLLNWVIQLIEKLPISSLKGFALSVPETALWYLVIILMIAFFRHSSLRYLRISASLIVVLVLINIFKDYTQSQQGELTFHALPKQSGISIIEGKSATFMASQSVINNKKTHNYYLKNYYDQRGINARNQLDIEQYANASGLVLVEFDGKRVVWLQKPFKGKLQGKADYVLLSNSATRSLKSTLGDMQADIIIVDESNSRFWVEKLKHEADSLGLNLIALAHQGALTIPAR